MDLYFIPIILGKRNTSLLGPQDRAMLSSTRRAGSHEAIDRLRWKGSREQDKSQTRPEEMQTFGRVGHAGREGLCS